MGTIQFNLGNQDGDLTPTLNAKQSIQFFQRPVFPRCTHARKHNQQRSDCQQKLAQAATDKLTGFSGRPCAGTTHQDLTGRLPPLFPPFCFIDVIF